MRHSVHALALIAAAWVVALVWGNDFPPGASAGVLPLLAMCLLGFPTFWEGIGFTGFMCALVGAAGWASGHTVHAAGLIVNCITLGVVLSLASAHRTALTDRLRLSHDHLERTVEERTAALRREVLTRRAAEARAVEASEAKSRFLANMSHELRTPLNAIKGYAELCTEVIEDADENRRFRDDIVADLGRVTTSTDRLLALVNDVLDLSRIEADMLELQPEATDLRALVRSITDELRPLIEEGGNHLTLALADLAEPIRVDPHRLKQILVNLVGNAAKFTRLGTLTVTERRDGASVLVEVHDTGIGIPVHAMNTLFDRFTQVDDSSTRRHEGTGLGLALSRDLARRMGGDLFAQSQEGVGSTFTLRLPIDGGAPPPRHKETGRPTDGSGEPPTR